MDQNLLPIFNAVVWNTGISNEMSPTVKLLARWWRHFGHLLTCEVGTMKNQQCERGKEMLARSRTLTRVYRTSCTVEGCYIQGSTAPARLLPASPLQHSTRATLLLLEGCGEEEGATHAPDQGNLSHLGQLHLQEGEEGEKEPRRS